MSFIWSSNNSSVKNRKGQKHQTVEQESHGCSGVVGRFGGTSRGQRWVGLVSRVSSKKGFGKVV